MLRTLVCLRMDLLCEAAWHGALLYLLGGGPCLPQLVWRVACWSSVDAMIRVSAQCSVICPACYAEDDVTL